MRHDWVFDVLTDLRAYAHKNGLPALAAQVEVALQVARAEIAGAGPADGGGNGNGGVPPSGRAH
ncbi:hypothetical protein RNZ50_02805 [Paracoccaceae bacterium Fryx2]|nr:hypothetical protein [Paracoccaceae bacterium Fryx2]